jgi:hypothetical protein
MAHVPFDDVGVTVKFPVPKLLDYDASGENLVGMAHEDLQQLRLFLCQLDFFSAALDATGEKVHSEIAAHQFGRV